MSLTAAEYLGRMVKSCSVRVSDQLRTFEGNCERDSIEGTTNEI